MITIKLIGGAKKSFSTDSVTLNESNITLNELIDHLKQIKPKNTLEFDTKNLLIAVNGIDSSALEGYNTKLNDNDVVSIIPIIHGGTHSRMQFSIMHSNVEIFHMLNDKKLQIEFLKELRSNYPHLILQALHFQFILGVNHVKKILAISLYAEKHKALLSKKIEVDILLRFAGTTQISRAIKTAGRKSNKDFFIIAIGKKSTLDKLHSELKPSLSPKQFSKSNHQYLKKQFKISKKQISTISSKNPLEDIIVEKAVLLF